MAINGKAATFARNEEKAGLPGHSPQRIGVKLTANDGVYPVGLLLTEQLDGVGVPLQEVSAEVLATGDGGTAAYTGTLAAAIPVEPGSLVVTDGVESFRDDGCGRLVGDAGGSGTIDYQTGAYSVTFDTNVGNGTDVTADYLTAVDFVLDATVDTASEGSGLVVDHGTVSRHTLKVGATAQSEPAAATMKILRKHGIWAV